MDRIQKALKKLTEKERRQIKQILIRLEKKQITDLDVKKLKGRDDIFRIRKGDIRIIYKLDFDGKLFVLIIERRKESTYNKI